MKRVRLAILGILLSLILLPGGSLYAATYDVNATVPYPAPTQPAVINSSLDNVTVENAAFQIDGTCEVATPPVVVTIMRGATVLGSQSCPSGIFNLQISLVEGPNSIVVRTSNVSGLYGPDSAPINVTLNTPPTPTPVTPTPEPATPNPPAKPGSTNLTVTENNSFNAAAQSGLSITPQTPFSVLPSDNQVSLSFVINGGSTPYTIELNWGDGTVETKVIDQPGNYTFTHQYRTAGNYTVKGRVKDVLGAITEVSYAVVAAKPVDKQPDSITTVHTKPDAGPLAWLQKHWLPTVAVTSVVVIGGTMFWLGESLGLKAAAGATQTSNIKTKTKPRTKQTVRKIRGKK